MPITLDLPCPNSVSVTSGKLRNVSETFFTKLKKAKIMTIVLHLHVVQWKEGIVPLSHQIIVLPLAIKLLNTLQAPIIIFRVVFAQCFCYVEQT